ncbi:ATP-binding protein [Indiicoccus explosivorum]|uniref:ATP-binding protein n=1 Tax=Indiicoccus explosivorum TaxID=1917864 RepID=UPI00139031CE|nr:AAA family ATPase [Indiicoccus explosivorum]
MRITKLEIFGFGRHSDRTIELSSGLSVFCGPNEAGKTTIQQFILQTLFGYPVRGGSSRRYEPKTGGRFGGRIHMTDSRYGSVIIERTGGKSAGEVTVYFEDGTSGGEDELKEILRNTDRASFEAVFSFSVHELQGLDRLTEEELSRVLVASGTAGMDSALGLADRLEKEQALLFKPNGRNPEMNRLISELRKTESELNRLKKEADAFGPAADRLTAIEGRLREIAGETRGHREKAKGLQRWLQALPLLKRKKRIEESLAALPGSPFPAEGKNRMERLNERLGESSAAIRSIGEELEQLEARNAPLPDPEPLDRLLGKEADWHRMRADLNQKLEMLDTLADDRERLAGLIGMPESDALAADVSIVQEEKLAQLVSHTEAEEEGHRFHARELEKKKMELAGKEVELGQLLAGGMSDSEIEQAQAWRKISPEISQAKAAGSFSHRPLPPAVLFLSMLGVLLAAAAIVTGEGVWLAAAAAACGFAGFYFWKNSKNERPEQYQEMLEPYRGRETELDALANRWEMEQAERERLERDCGQLAGQVEELIRHRPGTEAAGRYSDFLKESGLPVQISGKTALALVGKLREFQATMQKMVRAEAEAASLQESIADIQAEAERAAGISAPQEELFARLRAERQRVAGLYAEAEKHRDRQEQLLRERTAQEMLAEQIREERELLLKEAGAETESAYYQLHTQSEERERLLRELEPVEDQLEAIGEFSLHELNEEQAEARLEELEVRLADLEEERNDLLSERAEKRQLTEKLLTDRQYAELQQSFEERKAVFSALAQKWAVGRALTEAIKQTMDELREKRLPAVLELAQKLFRRLTEGEYSGLVFVQGSHFEAIRKDGVCFHIAELSQATKEQAYLALRLALASFLKEEQPFPLIMDDPFVHFDRRRLSQMVNLMREMKLDHQFIFFTCHEELPAMLPEAKLIDVMPGEGSIFA